MNLKRYIPQVLGCLVIIAGLLPVALPTAAEAQSVLRTARGLASDDVAVLVNRAVVVESAQPFVEVSVAQPEIADVSPLSDRAIYIFGRARGITTLTLLGENGQLIANVEIRVSADLAELKQRLAEVFPNEPIDVRSAGAGVVLSGVVSGAAKIDQAMALAAAYTGGAVTNLMAVGGTQQVALKVRVAEMNRSVGKALGLSTALLAGAGNSFSPTVQTGNNNEITEETNDEGLTTNVITTLLGSFGTFASFFSIGDSAAFNIVVSAAENKGFARTLAEPTLVARSGAQASFLAGGEVPIPVVSEDGADVEFKNIGVFLSFLPTVLDDDQISIAVNVEVSSIDTTVSAFIATADGASSSVPGFTTRRANTTVTLGDNESFAIAGLYQEDFTDSVEQVPWLADLPIIGTLFRDTSFTKSESELVIIVTANLVVPVDGTALSIPQDRIAIPNERSLFLLGDTEGPAIGFAAPAQQAFDGSYGYVVE